MYILIIMVLKVGWFWVAGTNLHGDVKMEVQTWLY